MTPSILRYQEVESTQAVARALIAQGAPHGTLVIARRQRAGRGRLDRQWSSHEGGLWLSMIVRGELPAPRAPRLTLAAAALSLQALDQLGVRAYVKWPNDLMLPHAEPVERLGSWRKLGGLLLEGVELDAATVRAAVLGLGINVAPPPQGFSPALLSIATSVADAGLALSVEQVEDALVPRLQAQLLDALDDARFAEVMAALRARSATLGRRVVVEDIVGVAEALADDGALLLRDDDGALHTLRAGDVSLA